MVQVTRVDRKAPVLKRPGLPCMAPNHTVNLTAGCSHACVYCYARGFRSDPGKGRILFYANSAERLRRELSRKRKKLGTVYFSTMTDPFIPIPEVLDTQLQVMEMLLAYGASLIVSTKGHVPDNFLALFAHYRASVVVHVGINTVDECVRQAIEPNAAGVASRLANCRRLTDAGVAVVARIDPIIPGLSDDEEALANLVEALSECAVTRLVASYLFLRRTHRWPGSQCVGPWSYEHMVKHYFTDRIDDFCSGGAAWVPRPEYRRQKYAVLHNLAERHGMSVKICGCKNPDVATTYCMAQPNG